MENKEEIRVLLPLSLAMLLLLSTLAYSEDVYIAEIDGRIDAGTAQYISRVMDEAEAADAKLVLIKINSNSGFIGPTERIVARILDSKITVAGYSYKRYGGAFSCGAYILMASQIAAVEPESGFGAAQPVYLDNASLEERSRYMEALAETNHRNRTLAREFVTGDRAVDGYKAVEYNVAQYAPGVTEELLSQIGLTGATTKTMSPDLQDSVLSFLSDTQLIALVFMLACFTAAYALRTRSFVFALASIALFALAYWGFSNIRFSGIGVFIMVLGIFLVSLELLHTRPTILCIAGGLAIAIGLMVLSAEPFIQVGGDANILAIIIASLIVVAAVYVGNMLGRSRAESRRSMAESLVGKKGRVVEELRRNGLVKVDGRVWPAYSIIEERIPVDSVVEVVRLEGKVLTVVREGAPRSRPGHGHEHASQGKSHVSYEQPHLTHEGVGHSDVPKKEAMSHSGSGHDDGSHHSEGGPDKDFGEHDH